MADGINVEDSLLGYVVCIELVTKSGPPRKKGDHTTTDITVCENNCSWIKRIQLIKSKNWLELQKITVRKQATSAFSHLFGLNILKLAPLH